MATRTCPLCSRPVPDTEPMTRQQVLHAHGHQRWATWEPVCMDCIPRDETGRPLAYAEGRDTRRSIFVDARALDGDPQPCASCGLPIRVAPDKRRKIVTCSDACRSRYYSARADRVTPTAHVCSGCGETMTGRADRRFCSSACRQRAYRRRQQLVAHGISPQDAADVDAFGALDADQLDRVLAQARQDGDLSARHVADLAREVSGQS